MYTLVFKEKMIQKEKCYLKEVEKNDKASSSYAFI